MNLIRAEKERPDTVRKMKLYGFVMLPLCLALAIWAFQNDQPTITLLAAIGTAAAFAGWIFSHVEWMIHVNNTERR